MGSANVLAPISEPGMLLNFAPFYVGGVVWTMVYDAIYAYSDRADDKK